MTNDTLSNNNEQLHVRLNEVFGGLIKDRRDKYGLTKCIKIPNKELSDDGWISVLVKPEQIHECRRLDKERKGEIIKNLYYVDLVSPAKQHKVIVLKDDKFETIRMTSKEVRECYREGTKKYHHKYYQKKWEEEKAARQKRYSGRLGSFWYDSSKWEVRKGDAGWGTATHDSSLRYIGKQTDGSKIEIPCGIKICDYMFDGCDWLTVAPEIPSGVKSCKSMFRNCTSLTSPPDIPYGVKVCDSMYEGCTKLDSVLELPSSVISCASMYQNCVSLTKAPDIPDSVEGCTRMFKDCTLLKEAPEIPNTVTHCDGMFYNCTSLTKVINIPGSGCCSEMFYNCTSLETIPEFSHLSDTNGNVIKGSFFNMFHGCKSLKKFPDRMLWGCNCKGMFYGCKLLENGPLEIVEGVKNCDDMFHGCKSLKGFPVIPKSVVYRTGIFAGCSDSVKIAAKWNLEHRGHSYDEYMAKKANKKSITDRGTEFDDISILQHESEKSI